MSDVFTKAKRSEVMSRIRSRGNRDTELALASLFRRHGITGWRRQVPIALNRERSKALNRIGAATVSTVSRFHGSTRTTVRPDFVFPKLGLAVFVDGCFWHACPRHATKPRNNAAFWRKKLAANQARDRRVNRTLRAVGWWVLRIWEHELAKRHEAKLVRRMRRYLV